MLGGNYQHDNTHDNQLITSMARTPGSSRVPRLSIVYAGSGIDNQSNQRIPPEAAFGSLDLQIPHALTAQASVRYKKDKRIFDGLPARPRRWDLSSGSACCRMCCTESSLFPILAAPPTFPRRLRRPLRAVRTPPTSTTP